LIFTNVSFNYLELENFRNGKMDFLVKYSIWGKVSSICPRYFQKASWRY